MRYGTAREFVVADEHQKTSFLIFREGFLVYKLKQNQYLQCNQLMPRK